MSVNTSVSEGGLSTEVLRGIGLFGALDDAALLLLCERLSEVRLESDEQLYAQGEAGRALYVVLSGEMRLERQRNDPNAQPLNLGCYTRGEWFGERAVMDVMPRSCRSVAASPARLLKMRAADCDALYRHSVKAYALLMMNIARQLSRKLHVLQQRL